MYRSILRPLLFSLDAETSHHAALTLLGGRAQCAIAQALCAYDHPSLEISVLGRSFSSPVGLAAGFDKDCVALRLWEAIGFSHVEIGTITAKTQPGNSRPRIFRFPEDRALINRMGFPSIGADEISRRLAQEHQQAHRLIVGANIGKTKSVPIDEAESDYRESFGKVAAHAAYVAVNVSSPNTPELRKLQEKSRLSALLAELRGINSRNIPVLVKISPDLTDAELDEVLEVCTDSGISGIIATNTTFSREGLSRPTEEVGGLSGVPLKQRAREIVSRIHRSTRGAIPIVGVGGVSNAADAIDLMRAGASLIQIYTGLIFEGPLLVKKIKEGMVREVERANVKNIAALVGSNSS